ncbi:GTP pyrophosphokinase [Kurthia sibirica]|uniref:GTP pyrophosphokinase n=1 Tax=Kurthia sibirica TaxID=202750 RepID=A0A2U3ANJ0_9BACL|nr:GTP pyrophosphokinase family protein [Kurthia sibirica]PWI26076.1 GTP pyrophosphokinase [Kurthia sibirica]GEK34773.1 hypothetical protein KSI01_23060 [Kurthia sibirica]
MANIQDIRDQTKKLKLELTRFMMNYSFALDEIGTKVKILKEEFHLIHDYNPIEHVNSRLKTPESIFKKIQRKNLSFDLDVIKNNIQDIAGIRITCSFVSDIYRIQEMISKQSDIQVIDIKDYIKTPKSSGYQSLHLILSVPVFLSDREESVFVEMQIRTIAMDFWASLEHKIYYKYKKEIPKHLTDELLEAAKTAALLDMKMESLNDEINILKAADQEPISTSISADAARLYSALKEIDMSHFEDK